ncbi:MAG: DUF308 domain-containing protein [Peptoniphilaceae bacterium]|nr:DUF308 domain-containing protein [Peptoniphilaceae bacterium]MDY6085925.1 DUF308 domain-containing protein [Peptoniphilaceae bacterium]
MKEERKFDWVDLILGVLLFIAAFLALRNPAGTLLGIAFTLGVVALMEGFWALFASFRWKRLTGSHSVILVVTGVISIILGFFLALHIEIGILTVPYMVSFWILTESVQMLARGIQGLWVDGFARALMIILGILGSIAGIWVLFNPTAGLFTAVNLVGFFLIFAGVGQVISAFIGERVHR